MINQMTIIGLGLIGQSIAMAIQNAAFTRSIVGYDPDPNNAISLIKKNLIDNYQQDLLTAIKNADFIIITTPFTQYSDIFELLAENMKETATITDVESIKLPVIQVAEEKLQKKFSRFVPSHPIINRDQSYPIPDLLAERPVIMTPLPNTNSESLNLVIHFWGKMGGLIEMKSAEENDRITATLSHLPQILAFTLMNYLNGEEANLRYINKKFSDFTSVATECPSAWSDICLANRNAILKELTKFESKLKKLKTIIQSQNQDTLLKHFTDAKQLRESI